MVNEKSCFRQSCTKEDKQCTKCALCANKSCGEHGMYLIITINGITNSNAFYCKDCVKTNPQIQAEFAGTSILRDLL